MDNVLCALHIEFNSLVFYFACLGLFTSRHSLLASVRVHPYVYFTQILSKFEYVIKGNLWPGGLYLWRFHNK